MTDDIPIDFKAQPLSMSTVENTADFFSQFDDMKVTEGLPEAMPQGKSLEARIKVAEAEIEDTNAKIKKMEELEKINQNRRTQEQNQILERLAAKSLLTTLQAQKRELSVLQKQHEELRKKVTAGRGWVKDHVSAELMSSFREGWDSCPNNKLRQFFKGVEKIVERLKVTPIAVLQKHRTMLNQIVTSDQANTIEGALGKLYEANRLLIKSAKHAEIMEFPSVKLMDHEAIHAIQSGVCHEQGVGDLTEAIQVLLDKGATEGMTWTGFYLPLRAELEKRLVASSLKKKVPAAAFTATAVTSAPQQGVQHQGNNSAITAADIQLAVANAFNAQKTWDRSRGGGGGRGGDTSGDRGGGKNNRDDGGNTGAGICFAFAQGKCNRGSACRFKHISADKNKPIIIPDCRNGQSCRNDQCVFSHPDGKESDGSRQGTPTPEGKRPRK